jgi:ubiquinone biosynthesis protein UbiJ
VKASKPESEERGNELSVLAATDRKPESTSRTERSEAERQRLIKTCGAANLEGLELAADVELPQSCVELADNVEVESKTDASE